MPFIKKTEFPEVRVYASRKEMGEAAASRLAGEIANLLKAKDTVNIIFAAAPSQNEFLAALSAQDIKWERVQAFHMDEYIGLDDDATQRFGNFLKERLFSRFNFAGIHYINGNATDAALECSRYSALLKEYPADIVCMGIGENGHIAFNDPHVADFNDPELVKVVALDRASRQQQVNDGCFKQLADVPVAALTLTIPALMRAKVINCVVPGPAKAQAVLNTMHKPVSVEYPSTILRTHQKTILFLDEESNILLS